MTGYGSTNSTSMKLSRFFPVTSPSLREGRADRENGNLPEKSEKS